MRRAIAFRAGTAALLLAGLALAARALDREEPFPHEKHAGLFPVCAGCHQGVGTGDTAAFYPPATACAGCHDGVAQKRVDYVPPTPDGRGLLAFDHAAHEAEASSPLACERCHTGEGAPRMAVRHAVVDRCLTCHEQGRPPDHLVAADCTTCHRTFAASGLPAVAALDLPQPAPHAAPAFLPTTHGADAAANPARCAVCHVRERCAACHVDAAAQPSIAAIPAATARPVALPAAGGARYPEPASHRDPEWLSEHGASAASASCATCHTAESCRSCHRGPPPSAVAALPSARTVAAPGALVERGAPPSHAAPAWRTAHGDVASGNTARCAACHVRTECESCHSAAARAPFHPPDFEATHATAAYAQRLECSTCHSAERFCRDCHAQNGMTGSGRLGPAFHDAEPVWLLRHGQAARQALETCASCHAQTDCLQCHSQLGRFGVSPHGPDFDARRAQERNARVCFACHVDDPLRSDR